MILDSRSRLRLVRTALALLFPLSGLSAAPQNVLVLGDSLSEEYAFELPFSAPNSRPGEANIRNWIEILATTRAGELSFGSWAGSLAAYPDYRNGGYAFNWAAPGFQTTDLVELLHPPVLPRTLEETLDFVSLPKLENQLRNSVAWAVVFCGGNDASSRYGEFYAGTIVPGRLEGIRDHLAQVIAFVQATHPAVRIVLVNTPDVGVTPSVQSAYPDAARRAVATDRIAALNALLATLASERGVALADVFALTGQLDGTGPLLLNGTPLLKAGHPENEPRYLFAKDGFHASTAAQALIANVILQAMNARWAAGFTPLENREILATVLGLDPDQPFRDWLAATGLPGATANDDPDGDGIPLLAEYALGLRPDQPDTAPWAVASSPPSGSPLVFTYPLDRSGGYAETIPEWNTDLGSVWSPVPPEWMASTPTARTVVLPAGVGPRAFLRLRFQPAP